MGEAMQNVLNLGALWWCNKSFQVCTDVSEKADVTDRSLTSHSVPF